MKIVVNGILLDDVTASSVLATGETVELRSSQNLIVDPGEPVEPPIEPPVVPAGVVRGFDIPTAWLESTNTEETLIQIPSGKTLASKFTMGSSDTTFGRFQFQTPVGSLSAVLPCGLVKLQAANPFQADASESLARMCTK